MIRDSSLQAYEELVGSGKAANQEARILKLLIDIYPRTMTRREIAHEVDMETSAVSGRVNTLIKKDVLVESEKRTCILSGKYVNTIQAVMTEDDLQGKLFE